jgi:hypothetical protein
MSAPAMADAKPTTQTQPGVPPKGAIILFNGKDVSGWTRVDGGPFGWQVKDGAMICVPKKGSVRTKRLFGDQQLHVEFRVPRMPDAKGQARGNSGVYLQGLYEIQVLDSHGIAKPGVNDCGALYECHAPAKNACKPPEQWQSYDITFRAPTFGKDGKVVKQGTVTVVHNGVKVLDNKEIKGPTRAAMKRDPRRPGPLMLQDHGNTVAFRNIWLVPLK